MVDNTLRWFGIYEEKAFEDVALMATKIFEEILCKFECCVFYTFEVYGQFFMYEYLDQFLG